MAPPADSTDLEAFAEDQLWLGSQDHPAIADRDQARGRMAGDRMDSAALGVRLGPDGALRLGDDSAAPGNDDPNHAAPNRD
jgi:hypothetical protein